MGYPTALSVNMEVKESEDVINQYCRSAICRCERDVLAEIDDSTRTLMTIGAANGRQQRHRCDSTTTADNEEVLPVVGAEH